MQMTRDELEYAISQYLDGTLPLLERNALEERLATDADARAMLAEYQKLDTMVKSAIPVPRIEWDRFAAQVQQAVAAEEPPVRHYRIGATQWVRGLAMAAALVCVATLAIYFAARPAKPTVAPSIEIVVAGPAVAPSDAPVVNVAVGPAPTLSEEWFASQDVLHRPTVVLIDRAGPSVQDADLY